MSPLIFIKTGRDTLNGKIKRIVAERGFGFITGEDGTDYFFHRSGLALTARRVEAYSRCQPTGSSR